MTSSATSNCYSKVSNGPKGSVFWAAPPYTVTSSTTINSYSKGSVFWAAPPYTMTTSATINSYSKGSVFWAARGVHNDVFCYN